jgi:eukaryotic-like serine/threonine-protein kinase
MSSDDSRRLRNLYAAALQRDPEERDAYLDRECAGHPELRARVTALLEAHAKDFLEDADAASSTRTAPVRAEPVEGRAIGPYIVRRLLGRGGMGVVYLVDDTRLSRPVALKALAPEVGRDPGRRERLRLEARAAAALSHPGIATVYSLDEIGDDLYLACEYVPGVTLRTVLASGPLPIAHVVTTGAQLARALAAAHTIGVVHRDIKPENVMKTPGGVVKILDFGLARMEGAGTSGLTQAGVIVGTPAYMSPEQVLGQRVDFRTDLFAFGVLLYELASGVNPFLAKTVSGTLARIVDDEPAGLSRVRPQIPPELERIVARCLRKDPVDRYGSTLDLVADLEQLEMAQLRHRTPDPGVSRSEAAPGAGRTLWWLTHQVIIVGLYVVAAWLGWHIKEWVKVPVTISIFIGLGAGAATGGVLRGHLVFTEYVNRQNLPSERRRVALALIVVDVLMGCALVADAFMLARWPLTAVLTMALGIGIALAAIVLEPATTKATLEDA